ncbi:unnamed protein product [Closterium sp. NIES-54]
MYLMTCTRPDLAYPLSILAGFVAPGKHRPSPLYAAKRVAKYVASTSGMGLVLGGKQPVSLTGFSDSSWADDAESLCCEAEVYAAVMAAQELCCLSFLLTNLGERPRSPFVLFADNRSALRSLDWLRRRSTSSLVTSFCESCSSVAKHSCDALYDGVVARYSSPATAALGRLLVPYLFPELSAFATVEDLVLGVPSSTCLTPPLLCPPPDQSQPPLQPACPLLAPSPYSEQAVSPTERREPASHLASLVRTARCVPRLHPPLIPGTHAMAVGPSSVPLRVPLPAAPESSLPAVPDPKRDRARAASLTVSRLLATVVNDPSLSPLLRLPSLLSWFILLLPVVVSTPLLLLLSISLPVLHPSGEAMDSKMASWKSTGTYVDTVPPSGANIVDGMWIFRVKRAPGFPLAFKARYVAQGFSQRQGVDYFQTFSPTLNMTTLRVLLHVAVQRDYELYPLDFSTAFLQGSLHEEIWLRRPPGFTGSFPVGILWSLRRPVYGLR